MIDEYPICGVCGFGRDCVLWNEKLKGMPDTPERIERWERNFRGLIDGRW